MIIKGIKDFTDPNFQPPEEEEKGTTKDNFVYAGETLNQSSILVKATGSIVSGSEPVFCDQDQDFRANKITLGRWVTITRKT